MILFLYAIVDLVGTTNEIEIDLSLTQESNKEWEVVIETGIGLIAHMIKEGNYKIILSN